MLKKNSPTNIPLLKGESFHQSYFKQTETSMALTDVSMSLQHVEVDFRCLWKKAIPAHRLDHYLVFLVTAGEGIHTFGAQEHYIHKNMLCFIGPHVINTWHSEHDEHRGYFCSFSDDFFNLGRENKQFLAELPFFQLDGKAVIHLSDEQMEYYAALFKLMQAEYKQRDSYSHDILRNHLYALLSKAYADYRRLACHTNQPNHPGLRLLKAFTSLYMRDFSTLKEGDGIRIKKVADYADELGVSQNHLNDTVRVVTGQSAGRLIRNQLVKHATMCLVHSTNTISEIAYRLGFDDPSYFARFYKKQTGKSPSDLR